MKKITQQTFNIIEKKAVTHYMENFITHIFSTPLKSKADLLPRLIQFTKHDSLGELILKQTLMKGTFQKAVWQKQDILVQSGVLPSITTNCPKENTDVRFLSEILTADAFMRNNNPANMVKMITFNSEKPQKGSLLISRGNQYKDATVDVNLNQNTTFNFEIDVKIGNNGLNDFFTGALCPFPLTPDYKPICILNNPNDIDLNCIQEHRIDHLNTIQPPMLLSKEKIFLFKQSVAKIQEFQNTTLDPIVLNNLIQRELLICLSLQILHKQPSLFAVIMQTNNLQVFNGRFFDKLQPYIKPNIFDNKVNYVQFMRTSLKVYNETVKEIAANIENSSWQGTGFEHIADDLFK